MRWYATLAGFACPWAWLCYDMSEGIAMMDKVTEEAFEEGRETALVKALAWELRAKREDAMRYVMEYAAAGELLTRVAVMAARAKTYDEILKLIGGEPA